MTERTPPIINFASRELPDVDLDNEVVLLPSGRRLTQAVADEIVEDFRRSAGRPSLTGGSEHSPAISFRVDPVVKEAARKLAEQDGVTVSDLARAALLAVLQERGAA